MEVSKADLQQANETIQALQTAVGALTILNGKLTDKWEESQVEIERLKARLAEWEVVE